jgi:hypothetical protein
MFCIHDRLDCDECNHHVRGFPAIRGETVSRTSRYIEECVKPERRNDDVRYIKRADGSTDKCFRNWGLPGTSPDGKDPLYQWCASRQEVERKCKETGNVIVG